MATKTRTSFVLQSCLQARIDAEQPWWPEFGRRPTLKAAKALLLCARELHKGRECVYRIVVEVCTETVILENL
jgi:hypothetical protein